MLLYNEFDANGTITRHAFTLGMYDKLPDGHTWVEYVPPEPTVQERIAGFTVAIQTHLDEFAKQRGYDGILSGCTYATSTILKFQKEGQDCVNARDTTWSFSYAHMASVLAGNSPMPASNAELVGLLPPISWTE